MPSPGSPSVVTALTSVPPRDHEDDLDDHRRSQHHRCQKGVPYPTYPHSRMISPGRGETDRIPDGGYTSDDRGRRMTAWRTRLVGRDEPLAALDELRRAALAGEGAVALVTGEAGIGKSALVEAAAARAAADGRAVLAGRAVVDEGAPASGRGCARSVRREPQGSSGLAPGLLDLPGTARPVRGPVPGDRGHGRRAARPPPRRPGCWSCSKTSSGPTTASLRLLHRLADRAGRRADPCARHGP